jgi:uncharacterized protein YecT (DUF1311 family)
MAQRGAIMIRLSVLACCLALPAAAQEFDCENAMAQQEMNACAYQAWEAADADLNAAYKLAMAEMKDMDANMPEDQQGADEALRAAQRAWIAYRDANCVVAGFPMRGGSAEPLLVYGCMSSMTETRTAELLELLSY